MAIACLFMAGLQVLSLEGVLVPDLAFMARHAHIICNPTSGQAKLVGCFSHIRDHHYISTKHSLRSSWTMQGAV